MNSSVFKGIPEGTPAAGRSPCSSSHSESRGIQVWKEYLLNGLEYGGDTSHNSQEMLQESIVSAILNSFLVVFSREESVSCRHGHTRACATCIERIAAGFTQHFLHNNNKDSISLHEPCPSPRQTADCCDEIDVKEVKLIDLQCKPPPDSERPSEGICLRTRTKNVPERFALCVRGCSCKLCGLMFKGLDCSDRIIAHVSKVHSKHATPEYLEEVAQSATPKAIIGEGMLYCGCRRCTLDRVNW